MNPGKEKAPEGAQVGQNPDTAMPDSQGFLEAKNWLGMATYESLWPGMWDNATDTVKMAVRLQTWTALVVVHGELSARLLLVTKYDTVKGGSNG